MADEQLNIQIGARLQGLTTGLAEARAAVQESTESMRSSFESLGSVVSSLATPFAAVAAAFGAGELFEGLIEHTAELGEHMEVLGQKTGLAADALSQLEFAASLSEVQSGALDTGLARLSRSMQDAATGAVSPAAEALRAMGISATDSTGHLRPLQEVLLQVADKFKSYEDGAGKAALAMDLFGRSGTDMIPLLNQGRDGIEALGKESDKLGATLTTQQNETIAGYNRAMHELHGATTGITTSIATAFMPALTGLATSFSHSTALGDALKVIVEGLAQAFNIVAEAIDSALALVNGFFVILEGAVKQLVHAIEGVGLAIWDVAHGRFAQAKADMSRMLHELVADNLAVQKSLADTGQAWLDAMHQTLGMGSGAAEGGGGKKTPAPTISKSGGEAKERQKQFQVYLEGLKTQEVAARDSSAERIRIAEEETAITEEFYGRNSVQFEQAMQHELEVKHQASDEKQKQDVKDFNALAKILADMGKEHERKLKEMTDQWNHLFDPIAGTFDKMVTGILQGTQTMSTAFRNLWSDFVLGSINAGLQSLAHHGAAELAKRKISEATLFHHIWIETQKTFASAAGATERLAIELASAIKSMFIDAGKIFTGMTAWLSDKIGPFAIPAAIGLTGTAIGLGASLIHSAAGGFDIPAGVNPMTQLHSAEMVLPAELANKVRGMTDGGGSGEIHLHVHAIDAQDAKRFLLGNHDTIGHAIATAIRNNHSGLRKALGKPA